jgi:hypothetical protein
MSVSRLFALSCLSTTLAACATRSAGSVESVARCPGRVRATISNPQPYAYDVFYQDGQSTTPRLLGEITPQSSRTFDVPGDGQGRVYLRRNGTDNAVPRGDFRSMPETRIRMHCQPVG